MKIHTDRANMAHSPYTHGALPSHSPPPGTSPTQYPHQPIAPLNDQAYHNSQPPPASPLLNSSQPQTSHQYPPAMASPGQEKHEYYSTNAPQQAGIPMQNHPGMPPQQQSIGNPAPAHVYHTVTPIQSLSMAPAPVDCPVCHTRALTRVEQHSGNTTQ